MVRLAVQDEHDDDHDGRWDEGDPVDPSPADGLGSKPANDGSQTGTQHRTQHPDGDGAPSLADLEKIGDNSAANSLACRATNAAHEAEEDECVDTRC